MCGYLVRSQPPRSILAVRRPHSQSPGDGFLWLPHSIPGGHFRRGTIIAVVDCKGNVTESISDGAGGTLGLIGPDGDVTSLYREDPTSHLIRTSDGSGGTWTTELDHDRMHRVISPEGTFASMSTMPTAA